MAHFRSSFDLGRREPRVFWHALLAGALSFLASFTSSGCDSSDSPDTTDEAPRFEVGTAEYEWVDESRPELFTAAADDHRIVPVRAWYPARASAADRAPYFLNELEEQLAAASFGLAPDGLSSLEVPARVDAPLADAGERFPVLIFSPGMGTPPEFYGYQLADLASRGYVIFALAHPYATGSVVFADGSVASDVAEDPDDDGARDRSVATWSEDQRFVLSRVQQLAEAESGDRMSGRLDVEHVGAFGHSRGAAAATESCLLDARFAACANLDGSVSSVVLERAFSRPLLLMRSEIVESTLDPFFAHVTGPAQRVFIHGAGHNDFSDLPIVVRDLALTVDPESLLLGSLAADRVFDITAAYLAAFFDAELRGGSDSWFFEPSPFTEVEVTHGGSSMTNR